MGMTVRGPVNGDVPAMARVLVDSWRETYRGLMPDDVLDDPSFVARRERFWSAALSDPQYSQNKIAVAELDGQLIGVGMSGPARDEDATWDRQLYILYTYAAVHGLGVGAALLDAVIEPTASAGLWVADPNPRAQAFYRKHGFAPDGASQVDNGVREIRMVRRTQLPHGIAARRLSRSVHGTSAECLALEFPRGIDPGLDGGSDRR
jgi:GNAT superfamily N-acetyltransferase